MFEWDYLIIFVIAVFVGIFGTLAYQNVRSHPTLELPSPQDRINQSQIKVYEDHFCVYNITGINWGGLMDSNSMDPIMDEGADIFKITPESPEEIKVGDIISFKKDEESFIIHQVIRIEEDQDGIYYVTKGTNNYYEDDLKIRFDQVTGVYIGVLW